MMSSINNEGGFPDWFRLAVCGTPLTALVVATFGVAFGSTISPVIFAGLTALSWRVITKVLGIESHGITINLPAKEKAGQQLSELRKAS